MTMRNMIRRLLGMACFRAIQASIYVIAYGGRLFLGPRLTVHLLQRYNVWFVRRLVNARIYSMPIVTRKPDGAQVHKIEK